MKKLALGIALLVMSQSALALSENAKFVPVDNSLESNLCVVAATEGYNAAKLVAKSVINYQAELLYLTSCNGVPIKKFALDRDLVTGKTVKFVPADSSVESNLCALAASDGFDVVAKQSSADVHKIMCNGQPIRSFAKRH